MLAAMGTVQTQTLSQNVACAGVWGQREGAKADPHQHVTQAAGHHHYPSSPALHSCCLATSATARHYATY